MPLDPEQLTIVGILVAIGLAGMRKVWIWGWVYADMEEEREFWRNIALGSMGLTDKAIDVASKKSRGS